MIENPYAAQVEAALQQYTAYELAEHFVVLAEEREKLRVELLRLSAKHHKQDLSPYDEIKLIEVLVAQRDEARASLVKAVEEIGALTVAQANLMRERDEARADYLRAEEKFARLAEQAGDENLDAQDRQGVLKREMDGLRKMLDEARAWASRAKAPQPEDSVYDILAQVGQAAFVRYAARAAE